MGSLYDTWAEMRETAKIRLDNAKEQVSDYSAEAKKALSETYKSAADNTKNTFESALGSLVKTTNKSVAEASMYAEAAKDTLGDISKSFKDTIDSGTDDILSGNLLDRVTTNVSRAAEDAETFTERAYEDITNNISRAASDMTNTSTLARLAASTGRTSADIIKETKRAAEDAAKAFERANEDAKMEIEQKANLSKLNSSNESKPIVVESVRDSVKALRSLRDNEALPKSVRDQIASGLKNLRASQAESYLNGISQSLLEGSNLTADQKKAIQGDIADATGLIWVNEFTNSRGVFVKGHWRKRSR